MNEIEHHFDLNDILEVILITYNRKKHLKNTLEEIFAENSPIKDLQITILDNKSTDGSSELIEEYVGTHKNINHIVHRKNIGGNVNMVRAMEIASKKYVWIICDDDEYDWTYWKEVEDALINNFDGVLVCGELFKKKKNLGLITRQMSFLPACIYKTELITESVLQNAYFNVNYFFPHMAIICKYIEENKKLYHVSNNIVTPKNQNKDYARGCLDFHPYALDTLWIVGFINSIQIIKDKKKKTQILNSISDKSFGFFSMISAEFKYNRIFHNNSLKNICDVFCGINFSQKIQFLLALIWLDIVYFVKKFILRKIK